MREMRPPKPDDQENAQKAYLLLIDFMSNHPEIEPTLWFSATWSALINGYVSGGFSYPEFLEHMKEVILHYKEQWPQPRD
jgi:hypothetical protein